MHKVLPAGVLLLQKHSEPLPQVPGGPWLLQLPQGCSFCSVFMGKCTSWTKSTSRTCKLCFMTVLACITKALMPSVINHIKNCFCEKLCSHKLFIVLETAHDFKCALAHLFHQQMEAGNCMCNLSLLGWNYQMKYALHSAINISSHTVSSSRVS